MGAMTPLGLYTGIYRQFVVSVFFTICIIVTNGQSLQTTEIKNNVTSTRGDTEYVKCAASHEDTKTVQICNRHSSTSYNVNGRLSCNYRKCETQYVYMYIHQKTKTAINVTIDLSQFEFANDANATVYLGKCSNTSKQMFGGKILFITPNSLFFDGSTDITCNCTICDCNSMECLLLSLQCICIGVIRVNISKSTTHSKPGTSTTSRTTSRTTTSRSSRSTARASTISSTTSSQTTRNLKTSTSVSSTTSSPTTRNSKTRSTNSVPQDTVSLAGQRDTDQVEIIVPLGSALFLALLAILIIVLFVLRRRRSNGKPAEGHEDIINNIAYGNAATFAMNHSKQSEPETVVYDEIPCEFPARQEVKDDTTFYDNAKQSIVNKLDHPNVTDLSSDNNYFVLEKKIHQQDIAELAVTAVDELKNKEEAELENKPGDYFVLEKPVCLYNTCGNVEKETDNSLIIGLSSDENVSHGKRTSTEENVRKDGTTCSGNTDENYFLVEEDIAVENEDDKKATTGTSLRSPIAYQEDHSSKNEKSTSRTDSGVTGYAETNLDSASISKPDINQEETTAEYNANVTRAAELSIDPYDHVRLGNVQTNGLDDGLYDELRKQHVRYETEEVDNDYDHCHPESY